MLLVMGIFLIPALVCADETVPGPAAQNFLNNLLLGYLFIATPLIGALGGVVVALIYRLRRVEFITAIVAMALAGVVSEVVNLVGSFCTGFNSDAPEPSPVWYYVVGVIIGWPFGIFVLRHKKQKNWNGLLASVVVQAVAFVTCEILTRV